MGSKRPSFQNSSMSSIDELALMRAHSQRQRESLKYQQSHFDEWMREEGPADKSYQLLSTQDTFELASISMPEDDVNASPRIYENWRTIKLAENQQISSKILRSYEPHSLKTQGIKVEFTVELGERSEVWIMSRDVSKTDLSQSCIKIGRDFYNERIFVKHGAHIGPDHEFRFFRNYEITADIRNYSSFTVQYFDYGNECITVSILSSMGHKQTARCNKYVPVFSPCYLMIAGIGALVSVKKPEISTINRICMEESSTRCKCSIY